MNGRNQIGDVSFIGGGNQTFSFTVYDKKGELLSLDGCEVIWTLSHLEQKDYPIIIKDNNTNGGVTIEGIGNFSVKLNSEDTFSLEDGKYEQEPVIIQPNGNTIRPVYGYVIIRKGSQYR